jgi:hypothetical protein
MFERLKRIGKAIKKVTEPKCYFCGSAGHLESANYTGSSSIYGDRSVYHVRYHEACCEDILENPRDHTSSEVDMCITIMEYVEEHKEIYELRNAEIEIARDRAKEFFTKDV